MKRRAFLFALLGGTLLLPLASDPARANLDESDEKGGNPLRRRRNASKRDRRRRQQINYKGREIVKFKSSEKPGTIIVKTKERALYQIMPGGKAMRYLVAVGKGFRLVGCCAHRAEAEESNLDAACRNDRAHAEIREVEKRDARRHSGQPARRPGALSL